MMCKKGGLHKWEISGEYRICCKCYDTHKWYGWNAIFRWIRRMLGMCKRSGWHEWKESKGYLTCLKCSETYKWVSTDMITDYEGWRKL